MAFLLKRSKFTVNCAYQSFRCLSTPAFQTFVAENEPMYDYAPGSPEKQQLDEAVKRHSGQVADVPIVIGDEEIRTGTARYQVEPFDHQKKIAKYYYASPEQVKKAIDVSLAAREAWERTPLEKRSEVFLRAADLMSTKYRYDLLATTMLGQAKNVWQAEIDSAAELIDFLRFNIMYARDVTKFQPVSPSSSINNRSVYRGNEGFWAAVTPFNFTAIGGHLPAAPALMGNVSLWKPSDTAILSNYTVYKIYREAGLPAGVINFLPAEGPVFGDTVTSSPHLAGINFTGSVRTFKHLWKQVAQNMDVYRTYPRLIGECGGKNMHFIHSSANLESVINGTVRAAFEFNGQKCSACSRMYIAESMWPKVKDGMLQIHKEIKMGSPLEKESFVTAVIDDKAFARIKGYLDHAKSSPNLKVIAGGNYDDSKGYFVEPTIVESSDPQDKIMTEEIFGPVVTVYVYPDEKAEEVAKLANNTSPFALTCAIYAEDEKAKNKLCDIFRDTAGNFYINTKSTGSVVGQQPFGGGRLSGTNDKAGGPYYMLKFTSVQSVSEAKVPLKDWRYPSMN
ncbi:delta-1-pyrroline-5-carboxylate dehydrogenase, mitochondrial-like [Haliotis rufescens]|uniref:delta-1-pyrroline-5-carboxylate dehydrogenase, mitochondrial-like n=1 Tax=Haliotis rufescens TaxID=6454 RepID=UPI00201EF50A|nr:delta-1-pyrroline-5-carboxylate dehydrogenase, mitochondrial-like [Haliotis rufescens]